MKGIVTVVFLFYLFDCTLPGMVRLETTGYNECQSLVAGGVLNIKNRAYPGTLLQTRTFDSRDICRTRCCDLDICNAYVWHTTGHCFLFHCDSGDRCPIVPNLHAESGFLYRRSSKRGSSTGQQLGKKEVLPLKRDNQDENPGESNELPITKEGSVKNAISMSGEEDIKSVGNHLEQAEATENEKIVSLATKKDSKLLAQTTYEDVKREPIASHKNAEKGSSPKLRYTTMTPMSSSYVRPTKASHTTTTSLIAALCFGLMFLIAVLFLIGRRWYESVSSNGKSGYSRVSFLMNGM